MVTGECEYPKRRVYYNRKRKIIYQWRLLLKLLDLYDKTKKNEIIFAVIELYEYLNIIKQGDVNYLNLMQSYKRVRKLNDSEIKAILDLRDTTDSDTIKCGCCILLESLEEFKFYYAKLDEMQQKEFIQYPIVNLLPDNIFDIHE